MSTSPTAKLAPAVCTAEVASRLLLRLTPPEVYLSVLRRCDALYGRPLPYVAGWHQAPVRRDRDLAWLHLELFSVRRAQDKLKYLAGSESGMAVWINDSTPEQIADRLRAVG